MSKLLIHESPLQVLPSLAVNLGLNEAIILQQIHYWLNPQFNQNNFNDKHWVRNTYVQWQEQFPFWGEKTIRRAIQNLEDSGVLESFLTTNQFKKQKFYTINYEKLRSLENHKSSKTQQTCGSYPSGQNDQIGLPKWADRRGQNDQIDRVNLTKTYKDTETTGKTSPPLTPPRTSPGTRSVREKEEEMSKALLKVWNEKVQSKIPGTQPVNLTRKRMETLKRLMGEVFPKDCEANGFQDWKSYCDVISHCRFLLGENKSGFKVTLDWAMTLDNAYKILEGGIYDAPASHTPSVSLSKNNLLPYDQAKKFPDRWLELCEHLLETFGASTYHSWFRDLEPQMKGGKLILQTSTQFKKDYLLKNHILEIEKVAKSIYPDLQQIQLISNQKGT